MNEQDRQLAMHEAGHAVAGVLLELPVTFATRQSDDPSCRGYVRLPGLARDITKDKAKRIAIMLLCGPIMGDQPVPQWPLSDEVAGSDEAQLAILAPYLKFDRESYDALVGEAYKFTTTDRCVRTFEATTGFFEYTPTLDELALLHAQRIGREC